MFGPGLPVEELISVAPPSVKLGQEDDGGWFYLPERDLRSWLSQVEADG